MSFGILPITPAYGRAPKSKKAAQADLDAGLDWRAGSGQYISRDELVDALGLMHGSSRDIEARSADLRKVWMLKLTEVS